MSLPWLRMAVCFTALTPAGPLEAQPAQGQDGAAEVVNPLLADWPTPHGIPPFDTIRDEDFRPAFDAALAQRRAEVERIRGNPAAPTFENTVEALEMAGAMLRRVNNVFGSLTNTDTNEVLDALDVEITGELQRERDATLLDPVLFARVDAVWHERDRLGLDAQQRRLVELERRDFVRAGAALDASGRRHLARLNVRLAELGTQFAQNVLQATNGFTLHVIEERDLGGLPPSSVAAARAAAAAQGLDEGWVFGLKGAAFEEFMTYAGSRELRRRLYQGYLGRGSGGAHDNRAILLEIVRLRAERAAILGYRTHADWELEARMAGTPARARELLLAAWPAALARARDELAAMQAIADEAGGGVTIEAFDWWYYAERLRRQRYAIDQESLKPWFELGNVRRGAFHVAERLFGLRFEVLPGAPVWHPSVQAWTVYDAEGVFLGVFMADDFARASKRGGAWKSTLRDPSWQNGARVPPIVTNNLNLSPPADGKAALLSFEQVETLFHEFGHALHELLTTVRYRSFSGSRGSPRDFSEFPSQFLERYASLPEVLAVYARHHATGEPIPSELVERLRGAAQHNQGFRTTEFVAASLLDLAWHGLDTGQAAAVHDPQVFERRVLEAEGLFPEIAPRYRSTYFSHVFAGGYAAGYYGYLWSEMLEADAFEAFLESGGAFDAALAARLRDTIYAAGASAEASELYRQFRGRDAVIEPLLRKRGLLSPSQD